MAKRRTSETAKKERLPTFGRTARAGDAVLTDLGCPDCRGVLAVSSVRRGHLWFTCSIGHAFDLDSLLRSKEEELETALWTAVETSSEIAHLYEELARRARADGRPGAAAPCRGRAARARTNQEALREMIASDGPPTIKGARG